MSIELKSFLQKYSTIPNAFLEDFYKVQYDENVDTNFKINLDITIKWLNMRKDHLKETIMRTYAENIDYIIKKVKSKQDNPTNIIFLTNDCFKRLYVLSTFFLLFFINPI